jgi:hypothetical protein
VGDGPWEVPPIESYSARPTGDQEQRRSDGCHPGQDPPDPTTLLHGTFLFVLLMLIQEIEHTLLKRVFFVYELGLWVTTKTSQQFFVGGTREEEIVC